jgi:hypothetical protein
MNATQPLETRRRRFPTDVTAPSFPNQYRGSSGSPKHDGSQRVQPQPSVPKKDAVEPQPSR